MNKLFYQFIFIVLFAHSVSTINAISYITNNSTETIQYGTVVNQLGGYTHLPAGKSASINTPEILKWWNKLIIIDPSASYIKEITSAPLKDGTTYTFKDGKLTYQDTVTVPTDLYVQKPLSRLQK